MSAPPPPSPPFLKDETTNFPDGPDGPRNDKNSKPGDPNADLSSAGGAVNFSGSLHSLYFSPEFLRKFTQFGH